jgi:hypothetical protein
VTIAHEDSPTKLTVVQTLKTSQGARTMALDAATHRIYLAAAEYGPPSADAPAGREAPTIIPNSMKISYAGSTVSNPFAVDPGPVGALRHPRACPPPSYNRKNLRLQKDAVKLVERTRGEVAIIDVHGPMVRDEAEPLVLLAALRAALERAAPASS